MDNVKQSISNKIDYLEADKERSILELAELQRKLDDVKNRIEYIDELISEYRRGLKVIENFESVRGPNTNE